MGAVTFGVGVVAIIIAAILWVVGEVRNTRPTGVDDFGAGFAALDLQYYVIGCLVITGVFGMMTTTVGDWVRSGTDSLGGLLTSAASAAHIGAVVTVGIIAIGLAFLLAVRLAKRRNDGKTLILLAGTAFLSGSIPGIGGQWLSKILGFVAEIFAFVIAHTFGIS